MTLLQMNKISFIKFIRTHVNELRQLLKVLENSQTLINEWRNKNFNLKFKIHFVENQLIAKINKIYVRKN